MFKIHLKLFVSLIIIGILAGLTGIALSHVLHWIQHHAYQYALDGQELSFLFGVTHASAERRFILLSLCGILVGFGWYALHRYIAPPTSIQAALKQPKQGLPLLPTIYHGLLQIITVGLGSPLGREVAPREISSALASWWNQKFSFTEEENRLLIACAAGAGLAAIYNVPMAATIFILETLLLSFQVSHIAAAIICCATATLVSRLGLGDLVQYHLHHAHLDHSLYLWAILIGPILGIMVYLFQYSTKLAPWCKRHQPTIIIIAIIAFILIGILSIYFPAILGNGKAGNQLTFSGDLSWQNSLTLMLVKWLAILLALAAGAYGGLITPSMMMGSTFATTSVLLWNSFGTFPIPVESAALIGATAFLGVSLNMPLTALIFCIELTRVSPAFLFPMTLAMAGAYLTFQYLKQTFRLPESK